MLKKICFVATVEFNVRAFLIEHIRNLSSDYEITMIADIKNFNFFEEFKINAKFIPLNIKRKISYWADIIALFRLFFIFKKNKFIVVQSIAPKAGFLSMIAAFLANVPIRIHIFTGQVWITSVSFRRKILKLMDRLIAISATNILVDSQSQKIFLIKEGIISEKKADVLANGSVNGVNIERFSPNLSFRLSIRQQLDITDDEIVFLYLGRVNRDKGVLDLAKAFNKACVLAENMHLVIVGPDEGKLQQEIINICEHYSNKVHFVAYNHLPEQYFAASDIFCLPSYREGFGKVIIEAAASGIPSIATKIYGITDAIDDGITGLFFEPGDIKELLKNMLILARDNNLRKKMGEQARERAISKFSQEILIAALSNYYKEVLSEFPK